MIKVIVNGHDTKEVCPFLAFQIKDEDTKAGAVLYYYTEKSAQLDMDYLVKYCEDVNLEDVEYVNTDEFMPF